ncbi:MAG: protoporphyrinogen IX oxidase [Bacteroidetes bacterium]|nr:MAG: protoporphyrinogen IX oxidase [Bacteroidota bacterium]
MYLYIKAIHIIFIVTWFAALFYMPRLFVYFEEAKLLSESEKNILQKQYLLMQKRLWYGIAWPSFVITMVLGFTLLYMYQSVPLWMVWKLFFVFLLVLFHISCQYIFNQQSNYTSNYTSNQMRIWNEVATIFLVAIVFLVVLKDTMSLFYGLLGLGIFIFILMSGIKIYKIIRQKQQ